MANENRFGGDLIVGGSLVVNGTLYVPASAVGDNQVAAAANVAASKLEHQYLVAYAQPSATTAAAATQTIHVVRGATGSTVEVVAGLVSPNVGAATCTVNVKKNGSNIMSSAITLSSAQAARELVVGTVTTAALAAGDVLEIVVTATAGGGTLGTGLFANMKIREKADA